MKNLKLKLKNLKVESFITAFNQQADNVKGGNRSLLICTSQSPIVSNPVRCPDISETPRCTVNTTIQTTTVTQTITVDPSTLNLDCL